MPSTATSCSNSTIFRYTVNVSHLGTKCVEFPMIKLSDVNWQVELSKKSAANGTEFLGIQLKSSLSDKTEKWSCEAKSAFKLLPKDPKCNKTIVKYLPKNMFGDTCLSHGIDEFINWADFLEHYVFMNKAHFEIEISTNPLKKGMTSELDLEQTYCKFRVTVEKISELESCFSPEVIVRGIKWKLVTKKCNDKLGMFFYANADDLQQNWSYPASVTFRVLSFDGSALPIEKKFKNAFTPDEENWGYTNVMSWDDFTKKRFVVNDKANFEVEFNVEEPKPLWEIERYHLSAANSSLQCSVCLECFSTGKIFTTKCGHLFCQPCSVESIEKNKVCPMCNAPANIAETHPIYFP